MSDLLSASREYRRRSCCESLRVWSEYARNAQKRQYRMETAVDAARRTKRGEARPSSEPRRQLARQAPIPVRIARTLDSESCATFPSARDRSAASFFIFALGAVATAAAAYVYNSTVISDPPPRAQDNVVNVPSVQAPSQSRDADMPSLPAPSIPTPRLAGKRSRCAEATHPPPRKWYRRSQAHGIDAVRASMCVAGKVSEGVPCAVGDLRACLEPVACARKRRGRHEHQVRLVRAQIACGTPY